MPTKLTNTAGTWLTSMTLSLIARVHSAATSDQDDRDRGDVPGWVMITVTGPHSLLRALIGCSCKGLGGSRETARLGRRFDGPHDTAAPGSSGAV